ncbi:rod shape-determining protein RodA [Alphaproteobacteria bacterium]|nr:rod shape-determining protein RodA [Alphaproteobacteria bacterium]
MKKAFHFSRSEMSIPEKLWRVSWSFVLLIVLIASLGFLTLYSAAGGSMAPWASRQIVRFGVGVAVLLVMAMIDIRFWMKWAYVFYGAGLILLVAVEFKGSVGMGAQRWIDLGVIQIQPSEIMKIALILALARYFHGLNYQDVGRITLLIPPIVMVLAPVLLVLKQPDLGTAMMLFLGGVAIFFIAGVRLWKFAVVLLLGLAAAPIAWRFLHEYQKKRILIFLDPEKDPLGAGYHITQSKIALGSGGTFGKGYMKGPQSYLDFLPEKHTDFIFTMIGEEWGMVGGATLVTLYALVLIFGFVISLRARSQFARLVGLGFSTTFFLYVFINIAMVMGLAPVVGVPLPLISYGGTAMLTLLIGFGLLLSIHVHRDVMIGRRGAGDDY